jgi:biofilm PGA synthesis N-glycosyltransferase PgaC
MAALSRLGAVGAARKRPVAPNVGLGMACTAEKGLLVVSPVYNEGANLERTARSVAAQSRRPDRWLVVDDGSSDDTLAVARRLESELEFMTVVEGRGKTPPGADNLGLAREAHAFNAGLELCGWRDYELIGKLDGDVELPPEWFARLAERFEAEPGLGVAAGRLAEPGRAGWKTIPIPAHHVHGAVKLFRRECLEAIGGIAERLGWDTIDETYARMRGFATHSYPDLVARHHRPHGSADGRLRGRARHGECAWILHYGFAWVLLRSLKVARVPPAGLSGLAFLAGYLSAALRRVPRVEDPDFRRFVRGELRTRLARPLGGRRRAVPARVETSTTRAR